MLKSKQEADIWEIFATTLKRDIRWQKTTVVQQMDKDWNRNTSYQKYKGPNMVMCAFNPSTKEAKADRTVSSKPPGLQSKFQVR